MGKIEDARNVIEQVDKDIASLFEKRMNAVKVIAEYKRENGIPVLDEQREKQLTEKNAQYISDPEIESYYRDFLHSIFSSSKRYQHRLLSGVRVAYSGIEGSFASISARKIFPDAERVPYMNFADAYEAVVKGKCDFAVLPIENSYAGEVGQVSDLIFDGDLFVNGVYELEVSQCLLGVKGSTVDTIKTVVSHPQALEQCSEFIFDHKYDTIQAVNTARAAKQIAEQGDISVGAIASVENAELYGLTILEKSINKSLTNVTRFAVLSKSKETLKRDDHNTFIMMFNVNHEAGTLAKALAVIADHGFNMRVIRSRPQKEKNWQYYFYAEIEGDVLSENGNEMLNDLSKHCEQLKLVGSYKQDTRL